MSYLPITIQNYQQVVSYLNIELAELLVLMFSFFSFSPEQLEEKMVLEKTFLHLCLVLYVWGVEACVSK
jgi:hypothetical protein